VTYLDCDDAIAPHNLHGVTDEITDGLVAIGRYGGNLGQTNHGCDIKPAMCLIFGMALLFYGQHFIVTAFLKTSLSLATSDRQIMDVK